MECLWPKTLCIDKQHDPKSKSTTSNKLCFTLLTRAAIQTGVEKLAVLRVFLLSNNKIAAWSEVERLGGLTALEELLLVGNPLYNEFKDKGDTQNYRIEVWLAPFQDGVVSNSQQKNSLCISC